ncbi:MAG: Dabb family protein [Chitinophagaceae bacterium]
MKIKFMFLIAILFSMNVSAQTKKQTGKFLQHVVLFKFKDDAKPEDVKKIENAFNALKSQIKEIKAFEWGLNNSPENLNQGFTHCFVVSFVSEKDREAYLPHPKHKEFVALLGPVLDKVLVVDYWQK